MLYKLLYLKKIISYKRMGIKKVAFMENEFCGYRVVLILRRLVWKIEKSKIDVWTGVKLEI